MISVNEILTRLPEAQPSPRRSKSMTQAEKQKTLAKPLLKEIMTQTEPIVAVTIASKSMLQDKSMNHVGTVLGAGQNGKGGMNLWKDQDNKGYLPCRENAVLVMQHFTDEMMQDFLNERNWLEEEFTERVNALPSLVS